MLVYERDNFKAFKTKKGYIVRNYNKPFSKGHTHLKSLSYCKRIIDNVISSRKPDTKNKYLLVSHLRLSEDERYIKLINDLMDKKRKLGYHRDVYSPQKHFKGV